MSNALDEYVDIRYAIEENGSPVAVEDIVEVVKYGDASPEGYASTDLAAVVKLQDGRFAAIEAWCDTTGWDCRSGIDVSVHDSVEDAWTNGITNDGRGLIERGSLADQER